MSRDARREVRLPLELSRLWACHQFKFLYGRARRTAALAVISKVHEQHGITLHIHFLRCPQMLRRAKQRLRANTFFRSYAALPQLHSVSRGKC